MSEKSNKELMAEIDQLNEQLGRYTERALQIKQDIEMFKSLPESIKTQYAINKFQMQQARQFIASKAFPNITPEQAFVIIKAGEEMGLPPIEALNSLYIVNGQIAFYGKGLVNRLTREGYKIEYLNESEKGVDVRVYGEEFDVIEKVRRTDQAFKTSKAIRFAEKEKMRYHGVRMVVKFHLPHLATSAGVGDEFIEIEEVRENKAVKLLSKVLNEEE